MSSDLFTFAAEENSPKPPEPLAPLAHRARPAGFDNFFGQEDVLGTGKPLRKWIETDQVPSIILWGPPGCGKTTLAHIIASQTKSRFVSLSAVMAGVKEIKEQVESARFQKTSRGTKTILFIDEIHRFNKIQQDALLPHVEDGTVTLIGATTENPSFELNSALLSRARVVKLQGLNTEAIRKILVHTLSNPALPFGKSVLLTEEALDWLANFSGGDARKVLGALEIVSHYVAQNRITGQSLTPDNIKAALDSGLDFEPLLYDKKGEEHYNVISAFIKSLRDSDPDGGLYYMARMLLGGEDPVFIARRLVIFASEDIGNADPHALSVAIAVKDAVEFVGMPEARISLAQAVTYLATAPKSNASYTAISEAMACVKETGALPVPLHLRNAVTGMMKSFGYGQGYRYAHDDPKGAKDQAHLPKEIENRRFYEPKSSGYEARIRERLMKKRSPSSLENPATEPADSH